MNDELRERLREAVKRAVFANRHFASLGCTIGEFIDLILDAVQPVVEDEIDNKCKSAEWLDSSIAQLESDLAAARETVHHQRQVHQNTLKELDRRKSDLAECKKQLAHKPTDHHCQCEAEIGRLRKALEYADQALADKVQNGQEATEQEVSE